VGQGEGRVPSRQIQRGKEQYKADCAEGGKSSTKQTVQKGERAPERGVRCCLERTGSRGRCCCAAVRHLRRHGPDGKFLPVKRKGGQGGGVYF